MLHRLKIEPSTLSEFMLVRVCVCLSRWMEHKTYSFRRLFCKPIVVYHPSSLFFTRFHSSNVYLSLLGCYPYTHIHTHAHTPLCYSHPHETRQYFSLAVFIFIGLLVNCVLCFGPRTFRFRSARITHIHAP